ncbi:MarR family winged helix-turn-helix transcriptional regulator [Arthrobacter sp. zg-Y820]|uniref:MarR family winged helix-turn-helix transcriptional regulator n=1 Tax=unclassified Arthrobacter TaxID=235627 RepID=UPI001E459415|nr:MULTISPECIES: MarR family winged helix-turn-helix transcriptional regulator [unclassified Arthrobacter]MCC9198190.1 MarR family winged helix-turn-helix transcriptional regulator [Arthrobacter sp. zg-Y820]MDK1281058.1 MarR family winged helix-turn-helix transcriptional regulator [Arthrobacter sp. zg.Y820]MDK1360374.1 MarR family winged helix-turn-helix transcriptional regulator [Arthrobacter sp. zg-Y1219]WIB10520.1 MarR family winged helix-turn-helix transcriptional regulator [Arthrobacter sp
MTEQASSPDPRQHEAAIETLEHALSVLWRRARSNSHKVAREVHPDMEPAAYGLLVLLQRQKAMRLTDIAASIGIGKPSVSRQIVMLESLGLVQKHADPEDGRAQTISLTREGSRALARTQAARKDLFRTLLEDWDEGDLVQLGSLLTKLNDSYARER